MGIQARHNSERLRRERRLCYAVRPASAAEVRNDRCGA
jgi:hypothetical protein